jgi:signal transduction histidine kinase
MSQLIASGSALGIMAVLHRSGVASLLAIAVALGGALVIGSLITMRLTWGVRRIEGMVWRLSEGRSGPNLQPQWPLARMMTAVNQLGQRVIMDDQRHEEVESYREHLLRQVSLAAIQEERNRIARDLHDSIKQQLFSIGMSIAAMDARWSHDQAGAFQALGDAKRSIHEANVEMRALLHQLRPTPLEMKGFIEALREQGEALGYRTGAQVLTELGALPPEDQLPPGIQDTLFRIAQEAMTNIARHARATHVRLWVGVREETFVLAISDDGQGFDRTTVRAGMGMVNMQERSDLIDGELTIESAAGKGTVLTVRIPLITAPHRRQEDSMTIEDPYAHPQVQQLIRSIWLRTAWLVIVLVPLTHWNDTRSLAAQANRLLLPAIMLGSVLMYARRVMRRLAPLTANDAMVQATIAQVRAFARTMVGLACQALVPALVPASNPGLACLLSGGLGIGVLLLFGRYVQASTQVYQQLPPHQLLQYLMRDRLRLMLTTIVPGAVVGFVLIMLRLDVPLFFATLVGPSFWLPLIVAATLMLVLGWGMLFCHGWQRRLYRKDAWQ